MNRDLTNDLAYLEGQMSVALRYDAGKKLKCKQGYVQRGSACQKIGDKKEEIKKSGGGNNLARNIGAGLGAAALVGGAAAISARRQGEEQSPIQGVLEKAKALGDETVKISSDRRVRTVAIATGSAAVLASSVMGVNALDKKYQITDAALLTAYQASISQGERADKLIDGMKISDENKARARDLVGATKMFFAKQIFPRWGFELASVDSKTNSLTYKHKDNGSVYTMGSAGSAIITFGSLKRDEREGNPIYEMGFQVNEAFDRKGGMDSTTAKKIIRISKNAFKEHLSLLPDDCIIRCSPYDGDDAGKKRGSIYEKEGFTSIPGMPKSQLYAVKMDGEFTKLGSDFEKKYVANVVKNGKQSASSENKKDSLL
jgi:hypothetical protein